MTQVRYTSCDNCAQKDDPGIGIYHFAVTDVHGSVIGHLCMTHALAAMPYANWGPYREERESGQD